MPPLIVAPATAPPQPWRNGRGSTRVLALGEGWRVSVADLTEDGPFSTFPGLDRVFVPLGEGFELVVGSAGGRAVGVDTGPGAPSSTTAVGGRTETVASATSSTTVHTARRHRPITFPGEAEAAVRGLTEPTQALNVMTARGAWLPVVVVRAAGTRPLCGVDERTEHYVRPTDVDVRVLLGAHVADICFLPAQRSAPTHSTPSTTSSEEQQS